MIPRSQATQVIGKRVKFLFVKKWNQKQSELIEHEQIADDWVGEEIWGSEFSIRTKKDRAAIW